jgi:hypothetical protein
MRLCFDLDHEVIHTCVLPSSFIYFTVPAPVCLLVTVCRYWLPGKTLYLCMMVSCQAQQLASSTAAFASCEGLRMRLGFY